MHVCKVRNVFTEAGVVCAMVASLAPNAQAAPFGGFAPQTTFPVGIFSESVALGDLDGDGDSNSSPDLAVANAGSNTVSILINLTEFPTPSTADLNGDGAVNGVDLATLLAHWGTAGSGDIDGNGVVNAADLANLLANWGA